jgi:histidyl-tRNA synthetase
MPDSSTPASELVAPETLKGFQDLLPQEMILRNAVLLKVQAVYEKYGFLPIETPALEYLSTLIGTGGEETNKALFRFDSPEGDPIAMRFDLTVPFARLIAQYPDKLPLPFRRYHIGPVFRVDKPGPGRFRQFTQFDIDAAGSKSIAVDGEIVAAMADVMRAVGFTNADGADPKLRFQIRVNNRKLVDAVLLDANISSRQTAMHVLRVVDKLLKVGLDNVRRELGDGRIDESGDRIRGVGLAPAVIDKVLSFMQTQGNSRREVTEHLRAKLSDSPTSAAALAEMQQLADALDSLQVGERDAVFDPTLARGLDYYTGPVFEATLPAAPEFGSVMGGGRYDGLVNRFSNLAIPATGASFGVDRFLAAMIHLGLANAPSTTVKVIVLRMAGMPVEPLLALAGELRRADIPTQLFFPTDVEGPGIASKASMKQQLSYANSAGIPIAIIVGEDELKTNRVSIKDLQAGKEQRAGIEDRAEYKKAGKSGQVTVGREEMVRTVKQMLEASQNPTPEVRIPSIKPE